MVMCCSFPVPGSFCGYIYDTVGINIKGNFNLRNTASCRRDTIQSELAERFVILCKLSFTLQYVDINCSLVICRCGENLALLCRNGSISLNQPCSNTAHGFNGQGQRVNIQKKDIACACVACQLAALDGSADSKHIHPDSGSCWAHGLSSVSPYPCTAGIRVEPPTSSTLPSSDAVIPASSQGVLQGIAVLSTRSWVSSSNLALVRSISKCFGPSAVAVMKGRLMLVVVALEALSWLFLQLLSVSA